MQLLQERVFMHQKWMNYKGKTHKISCCPSAPRWKPGTTL